MTPQDTTEIDENERALALEMLSEGSVTVSDAAALVGTSRQLVTHWAARAGIDPRKSRKRWLQKQWYARLKKKRSGKAREK